MSIPPAGGQVGPEGPTCSICGSPVPDGRYLYCSVVCANRAKNRQKYKSRRARGKRYWGSSGKHVTPRKDRHKFPTFLDREILTWDCEGWEKRLRLIGSNKPGGQILKREGFTTWELLNILWENRGGQEAHADRGPLHFSFSFGYDVNLLLGDLGLELVSKLIKEKELRVEGPDGIAWDIAYIPKKFVRIKHAASRRAMTIWDGWGFFQTTFVKACEMWGIPLPKDVEEKKAERKHVKEWSDVELMTYNQAECDALALLIQKVFDTVKEIGIPLRRGDGSGALAGAWLGKYLPYDMREVFVAVRGSNIAKPIKKRSYPALLFNSSGLTNMQFDEFRTAVASAYFGGRIDIAACGFFKQSFHFDLNLAYSSAIPLLPNLSLLRWIEVMHTSELEPYGLYLISWDTEDPQHYGWNPLPWRGTSGRVIYPSSGKGWYWGFELEPLLPDFHFRQYKAYMPHGEFEYPLRDAYREASRLRMEWKKTDAPKALIMKHTLNSLYGKFAQQVGLYGGNGKFFQPIYAGLITAITRARISEVIRAMGEEHVIAVQTDSVFTDIPLLAKFIGEGPGKWEQQKDTGVLILEPGVYQMYYPDGSSKDRGRGFGRGVIDFNRIYTDWIAQKTGDRLHEVRTTRFIGAKLAAANPDAYGPHWREFLEIPREIRAPWVHGTSKRMPATDPDYMVFTAPVTPLAEQDINCLPKNEQASVSQPYKREEYYLEDETSDINPLEA